ncbi:MAG: dTDP-4-amino-4,6-dideoxygalactose transaminase [Planctomycetota bacterium]|jgi:dTDP-4-amino-4,6-dideoxygalactose transaminase
MDVPKNVCEPTDLAIFGADAAFENLLHVGRPNIGSKQRLYERFDDILERRWLTNGGPYVLEFERRVADLCQVPECVATCNGTIALEIMIRALGMTGEVIVPAFTSPATAHALQWQEIKPVFCDVDPATHNLDPKRIEELITPLTTGIIGVHLWGNACDVDALQEIADRRGLSLMFDASHAFACSHEGTMIGGFGAAESLSFHATNFFNTFEGGAILTHDSELAEKMRLMRNFGFKGKDRVEYLGSNGKMTEVCAAMGLTSFDAMDGFIASALGNYHRYRERTEALAGLHLVPHNKDEASNYHYIVVQVDESKAGLSRDELVRVLEAENVLARRYFYPGAHLMEPYRSLQPMAGLVLPVTAKLSESVMVLPTGESVSLDEIDRLMDILRCALAHPEVVRGQLLSLVQAPS